MKSLTKTVETPTSSTPAAVHTSPKPVLSKRGATDSNNSAQTLSIQARVLNLAVLGTNSVRILCPYCHVEIYTRVVRKSGVFTWVLSGMFCIAGCALGLFVWPYCWIIVCVCPFTLCVRPLKKAVHFCPNCGHELGVTQ